LTIAEKSKIPSSVAVLILEVTKASAGFFFVLLVSFVVNENIGFDELGGRGI
jgi:hypothetical protein